jgi:hypothetical protein
MLCTPQGPTSLLLERFKLGQHLLLRLLSCALSCRLCRHSCSLCCCYSIVLLLQVLL